MKDMNEHPWRGTWSKGSGRVLSRELLSPWSWGTPLCQDMNMFIDSVFRTPVFFFYRSFIALARLIINSTSSLSPFSNHGLIFLVTRLHLGACPEKKKRWYSYHQGGHKGLRALRKELGAETNVCLFYYFMSHSFFLPSPHSWLPWYHLLLTYLLMLWPPFTSSLWALYSSSLPIHIVISCIYLTAFLPLNVSITWPYYSWLHLLLLRPGLVPGAGMQHPGGVAFYC